MDNRIYLARGEQLFFLLSKYMNKEEAEKLAVKILVEELESQKVLLDELTKYNEAGKKIADDAKHGFDFSEGWRSAKKATLNYLNLTKNSLNEIIISVLKSNI